MFPIPDVFLTASDYLRLEQLARVGAQQGDMDVMFLLVEIDRAKIVPDDARDVESIVTIGSWVTYLTNWGIPRETVHLVCPEDLTSDPAQISVLSGLGAALLGLRVGDQMPYSVAGRVNIVRIESVNRSKPNIDTLAQLLRAPALADDDDDPGPKAAQVKKTMQ